MRSYYTQLTALRNSYKLHDKMKKLLTIIIASAVLYLLFAFITLQLNPFNWQEITRAFYVVLLVIIDFSILTAPKDLFE